MSEKDDVIRKLLNNQDFETLTDIYDYLFAKGHIFPADVTEFLLTQDISPQEILIAWSSTRIYPETFWECDKFTPNTILPKHIQYLGTSSFCKSNIQSVSCENVFDIENKAFKDSKLSSIEMPNIRIIKREAFSGCVGLTQIELPDSLEDLWRDAFLGCWNLVVSISRQALDKIYPLHNRIGFSGRQISDSLTHMFGGKQWVIS